MVRQTKSRAPLCLADIQYSSTQRKVDYICSIVIYEVVTM